MDVEQLEKVFVAAKRACYVGGGDKSQSSREGSHNLVWSEGPWSYRDSYFGGTDFLGVALFSGEETIYVVKQRRTGCAIAAA